MNKYLLPTAAILLGFGLYAWAQQVTTPSSTALVCAYNTSPPTVSSGQFVYVQCDSSGRLILTP